MPPGSGSRARPDHCPADDPAGTPWARGRDRTELTTPRSSTAPTPPGPAHGRPGGLPSPGPGHAPDVGADHPVRPRRDRPCATVRENGTTIRNLPNRREGHRLPAICLPRAIRSPEDAVALLEPAIALLDQASALIRAHLVYRGTIDAIPVRPADGPEDTGLTALAAAAGALLAIAGANREMPGAGQSGDIGLRHPGYPPTRAPVWQRAAPSR